MNKESKFYQSMRKAVSTTLENMAFMEAMEHMDQSYEIPQHETVSTSLLIHDPVQGEVRLAMTQKTLEGFTCNIFSLEPEEVKDEQKRDILNELLNTIAGLFMTNLLAADQQYQLGLPELSEDPLPEADTDTVVWKLMTDNEDAFFIYATGASLVALQEQA